MRERAEVLILGGGVIGLTTAYYLASQSGPSAAVLDRGPLAREASWAGAGIIPPGNLERASTPLDELRAFSAEQWPKVSAELRSMTGYDNGYRVSGGLELSADEPIDTAAWTNEGIDWQEVTGDEMRRIEPALAEGRGPAFFLPEMAQVRNPRHLQALIAANKARGVTLRPGCPVLGFEQTGDRITSILTGEGRLEADQYVVAAGAWSDALLAPLGIEIGSRPIRGQIALVRTATPVLSRVVMAGKRYLVPRDDGRVLIGSTEEDVGFDPSTTTSAITELLQFGTALVPALRNAAVERCWAGLRPGSPDGWPTLGRAPGFGNLWMAAGHFRAGLHLSLATGALMAEALSGRATSIPLEPFRPDRPRGRGARPAFRS